MRSVTAFAPSLLLLLGVHTRAATGASHPTRVTPRLIDPVSAASLFVSRPEPQWFGNPANPTSDPTWTDPNWLTSRFHFSFADYADPRRDRFGVLRVLNDDVVQPHRGFGTHPHRDMEIVTYIVDGELTHQDSTGTKETLGRGSVQFMTAGSGIRHSEFNHGDSPLRLVQMWFTPRRSGLAPAYGSHPAEAPPSSKNWRHLVSDVLDPTKTPVKINQDANVFVMEGDEARDLDLLPGRQAYLLCIDGHVAVSAATPNAAAEGHDVRKQDSLRLYGPCRVTFAPEGTVSLLLVEMARPP